MNVKQIYKNDGTLRPPGQGPFPGDSVTCNPAESHAKSEAIRIAVKYIDIAFTKNNPGKKPDNKVALHEVEQAYQLLKKPIPDKASEKLLNDFESDPTIKKLRGQGLKDSMIQSTLDLYSNMQGSQKRVVDGNEAYKLSQENGPLCEYKGK